jgi:hypothetical protein
MKLQKLNFGQIQPTKFGIDLMAESIAESVNNGEINALDAAIQLSAAEQFIKAVKEKIGEQVLSELAKHPKSKADINGCQVTEFCSVKYDYTDNNEWVALELQLNEIKTKQKEIEDYEKTYHKGNLAIKSATTTYKINIPK